MKTLFSYKNNGYLAALIFALLIFNKVTAQELSDEFKVTVGLIMFAPLTLQDKSGGCYGEAVDTIQQIFEDSNFEVTIYCSSPSRIYRDFNSGLVDLTINVKSTPSLANNVVFSEQAFAELEVVLFTSTDREPALVSAIRSFNYHGYKQALVSKGYKFLDTATPNEAIAVFLRGGSDSLLSYKRPMHYYIQSQKAGTGLKLVQQQYNQTTLGSVNTYFAVKKSHPKLELILSAIHNYYQQ